MSKTLTQPLKLKFLPMILTRDHGFYCFYCKQSIIKEYIYEHLNDDRTDNRFENLVIAHQKCNIEKIKNLEYKAMADEKLDQNEEMGLHYLEDKTAHDQNSSEIEINKALRSFTIQYISEKLAIDGRYPFIDALTEIVYLCQEKFGHGSEQTIRRYLKELTCSVAKWQVVKDDKNKKWICGRVLN